MRRALIATILFSLGLAGCIAADARNSWNERLSKVSHSVLHPWQRKEPVAFNRNWVSALPTTAVRAETLAANVPTGALAHFVPEFRSSQVRLVSAGGPEPSFRIININGHQIKTCADLHSALEKTIGYVGSVQVDVTESAASEADAGSALILNSESLAGLTQAVAPEHQMMRVADGGNQMLLLRRDGIRCGLTIRVERRTGLLQVAMSFLNCWGRECLLPVDVRASCEGQPLRCLSVAETLELLYGESELAPPTNDAAFSFAAVSEQDGFLIPSNYSRLLKRLEEGAEAKSLVPPPPAFTSVAGYSYPGPAILGDARALTGCMLQRTLTRPGMSERTGWIMFAGPALTHAGTIDVDVDLVGGPQRCTFYVPGEIP